MKCPDECGETLTINLDPQSGRAWRLYRTTAGLFSVYPSVWRETGCAAHFIIWRSRIYNAETSFPARKSDPVLKRRVLAVLSAAHLLHETIAAQLDEVPWTVLDCCRGLVLTGHASEGTGRQAGMFARK